MIDLSSAWLTMNVVMLDEKRVVVEAEQGPLIKLLADRPRTQQTNQKPQMLGPFVIPTQQPEPEVNVSRPRK